MQHLNKPYTEGQIIQEINKRLNAYNVEQFIFVPNLGSQPSTQLAFLEKTATNTLRTPEPLTLVDMRRYLKQAKEAGGKDYAVTAIHLQHLIYLDKNLIQGNQALLVNFNRNLQGTPKWGVVDLTRHKNPVVYCETPLSEAEKKALDDGLGVQVNTYEKARANSLASTGYSALAWLETKHLNYRSFALS